jgi:hypothetical protein
MKNKIFYFLIIPFIFIFTTLTAQTETKIIAVSLKILQKKLSQCIPQGNCPEEYLHLCGLTKIRGYVLDKENHDVILFGESRPHEPPLYTEDFVVALRNSWILYYTLRDNTKYYYNPGCSIDPRPELYENLNQIFRSKGQQVTYSGEIEQVRETIRKQNEEIAIQWENICQHPQDVVVLGIPFHTHFAKILVLADYYMKRISNGTKQLAIDDFKSFTDLRLDVIKKKPESYHTSTSTTRFWFYPGANEYTETDNIVLIKKCPVTLLTELEYSSDEAKSDPIAKQFTQNFTNKYSEIAKVRPVYAQLEGLFRFVALTKIFKYKEIDTIIDLNYFFNDFIVPETLVDETLPGIASVHTINLGGKSSEGLLRMPSPMLTCGGVDIATDIKPQDFKTSFEEHKQAVELKNKILQSRPETASETVKWNVRHQKQKVRITRFVINASVEKQITDLILQIKNFYRNEAARVDYFIEPTGDTNRELYLINDVKENLIEASIYDALNNFKINTSSVLFSVLPEKNKTIAMFAEKGYENKVLKFIIHQNKIHYFWQKLLEKINQVLSLKKGAEFINVFKDDFGKIIYDKIGKEECIAIISRGQIQLNFDEIFPNNPVVTVASHNVIQAEENLQWLLENRIQIEPSKTAILSGIPATDNEFYALNSYTASDKDQLIEIGKKLNEHLSEIKNSTGIKSEGFKLRESSLENIKRILTDKNIENIIFIAHSDGKNIHFFHEGKQVKLTIDDIRQLKKENKIHCKNIILMSCETGGRRYLPARRERTITEEFIDAGVKHVLSPVQKIDAEDSIDFLKNFIMKIIKNPDNKNILDIIKEQILDMNKKNPSRSLNINNWVEITEQGDKIHG